jgi:hypothetical protein
MLPNQNDIIAYLLKDEDIWQYNEILQKPMGIHENNDISNYYIKKFSSHNCKTVILKNNLGNFIGLILFTELGSRCFVQSIFKENIPVGFALTQAILVYFEKAFNPIIDVVDLMIAPECAESFMALSHLRDEKLNLSAFPLCPAVIITKEVNLASDEVIEDVYFESISGNRPKNSYLLDKIAHLCKSIGYDIDLNLEVGLYIDAKIGDVLLCYKDDQLIGLCLYRFEETTGPKKYKTMHLNHIVLNPNIPDQGFYFDLLLKKIQGIAVAEGCYKISTLVNTRCAFILNRLIKLGYSIKKIKQYWTISSYPISDSRKLMASLTQNPKNYILYSPY